MHNIRLHLHNHTICTIYDKYREEQTTIENIYYSELWKNKQIYNDEYQNKLIKIKKHIYIFK